MAHNSNAQRIEKNVELKQAFLANAISDISTYIQLADTKVSIIMGAVVAILVGIAACYEPIGCVIKNIKPCSWIGVFFIILLIAGSLSVILTFVFGIMTIRAHVCIIDYKSKWFLTKSTNEYSFDDFIRDIQRMNDNDIIINMTAELYKLNDINRQKMKTVKWTLRAFSMLLVIIAVLFVLFLVSSM